MHLKNKGKGEIEPETTIATCPIPLSQFYRNNQRYIWIETFKIFKIIYEEESRSSEIFPSSFPKFLS